MTLSALSKKIEKVENEINLRAVDNRPQGDGGRGLFGGSHRAPDAEAEARVRRQDHFDGDSLLTRSKGYSGKTLYLSKFRYSYIFAPLREIPATSMRFNVYLTIQKRKEPRPSSMAVRFYASLEFSASGEPSAAAFSAL